MTQKRIEMTDENREKNQPYDIDVIPAPVHPSKTTKFINYIIVVALIVAALGIGMFFKWSLADTSVLDVKNSPFPVRIVSDPTHQTGGIVFLKIDYCKNQKVDGKVRVSYVSKSREVFLPVADERLPVGCANREVPIVLPLNLLEDTYKIKFHVSYDLNPLKQDVPADYESQPITVGGQTSEK